MKKIFDDLDTLSILQINAENVKVSKLESELYMRRNFASSAASMSDAAANNSQPSSDNEELFARLRSSMEQGRLMKLS